MTPRCRQENGEGTESTEVRGPGMFHFGRRSNLVGEFQLINLATNPFGLRGVCREKRKGLEPFFARGEKLVLRLKRFRACRDAHQFLAVDKRVTLIAGQRPERQGGPAVVTIADWFGVDGGHDGPDKKG